MWAAPAQYYAPDFVSINGQNCSVQLNIPLQNILPPPASSPLAAETEASTVRSRINTLEAGWPGRC
jgi:hypothetical protein